MIHYQCFPRDKKIKRHSQEASGLKCIAKAGLPLSLKCGVFWKYLHWLNKSR